MGVANEVSAGVGIPKGGEAARNVAVGDTFTIHYSLFTIHFYFLPRVSQPRPKESVTTLGGE